MKKKKKVPLPLRAHESLPSGIRRIARGQIDAASRILENGADPHTAVHEARKALKKVRAILLLVAREFGRKPLGEEKRPFQDAARLLAPLRDADAQLKSLDELIQNAGFNPKDFAQVREVFRAEAERLARRVSRPKRLAVGILAKARNRVAGWPLGDLERKHLLKEIRRAYRKGRNALECSQQQRTPEAFHAWRKHVKGLWYHLRITQALLPEAVSVQIALCEEIGEIAGNARDLALLHEKLLAQKNEAKTALLISQIERRLPELQQSATECGLRLYAEKPGVFAKRLR